jgi:hypothetical protein
MPRRHGPANKRGKSRILVLAGEQNPEMRFVPILRRVSTSRIEVGTDDIFREKGKAERGWLGRNR